VADSVREASLVEELGLARYVRSPLAREWAPRVAAMAGAFAAGAAARDRDGAVASGHVEALAQSGYTALTVPAAHGGGDAGLADMCVLQEILAAGDGATALGVGWHLSLVLGVRASGAWPEPMRARVFTDAVRDGALMNSIASERETGSPSRGGRPTTRAVPDGGGYRLRGRKTFATFSPVLHWYLVSATLPDDRIGEFLVERGTPGVVVDETWDTLGMRATGSHDLVLDDAQVPAASLVDAYAPPQRAQRSGDAGGPLLHVPACYLGVALAARRDLLRFCWTHRPNSVAGPIAELPSVQDQIGRMEATLDRAHALLYEVADAWDRADAAGRQRLRARLGLAKVVGTEAAVEATDIAMRVVGGLSLSRGLPFERYFRDVRAGLHNPPMGDIAVRAAGRAALESFAPGR